MSVQHNEISVLEQLEKVLPDQLQQAIDRVEASGIKDGSNPIDFLIAEFEELRIVIPKKYLESLHTLRDSCEKYKLQQN